MKKVFIIIVAVLICVGLGIWIFDLAILSTGYPMGYMLYSGIYLRYILFIIQLVFVLQMCVSVLKHIYIHGSIISGFITGFIMLWYISCNYYSMMKIVYFSCMSILCFASAIHIMFKIRPKAEIKMGLFAGLMNGLNHKKKFRVVLLLLGLCIVCVIYVIWPKKWVCLYTDSHQFMNHSYEIDNDVLTIGDEFIIIKDLMFGWNDYKAGWKFYANKCGDTKVTLLSEVEYEENDDWERDIKELYVDENMHIHYDADFEYYTTVYEFFFFIIVNAMGLSLTFLLSGVKDILKNKNKDKIVNGAQ